MSGDRFYSPLNKKKKQQRSSDSLTIQQPRCCFNAHYKNKILICKEDFN